LFAALRRLHAEGRLGLGLDFKRLDHMDSPVSAQADSNIWAYATLAVTLLALWAGGWKAALAVAALGIAAYYSLGRIYVQRRLKRRVEDSALASLETWRALWRWGGIALLAQSGEECPAPEGNWMALVRRLAGGEADN
jgi:hypothetical protein